MNNIPCHPRWLSDQFDRETKDFGLEVAHDDGLYRHLLYRSPKTTIGRFEIVTWPGHLFVGGDHDGFTFRREPDMHKFFAFDGSTINPWYWAGKLVGGRSQAKSYSRVLTEETIWCEVRQAYKAGKAPLGLAKKVHEELIGDPHGELDFQDTAFEAVSKFEYGGFFFDDVCEWDCTTFDRHYLMSCHAILTVVRMYNELKGS